MIDRPAHSVAPTAPLAAAHSLWLGLDTGGTYTDAIVLADGQKVVASAKALTTHWDLSIGLGNAIRAVLEVLPAGAQRSDIQLVSVSTTLATNSVVENRFSSICTVLVGFDAAMIELSGLRRDEATATANHIVAIRGGHDATGEEFAPLDEAALDLAVAQCANRVEGFAVAARFSVRNPAHELRVRHSIRRLTRKPVTCAHELSSKLDAPRRALTAALNARLTPQIRHLIDAVTEVLKFEAINAPLMMVKGDGSLMKAAVALEFPVETILSGPAASVVGAGFLTGLADFLVADMGGTTTDCAVVAAGRPVLNADGAMIGGWRTMVEAVDVHTVGLGGDSHVAFDREFRLQIGPRKAMPLSLLAHQSPTVLDDLRLLVACERLPEYAAQYACRNPGREAPVHLAGMDLRVWDALAREPRRLSKVLQSRSALMSLIRLADAGLATIAAFTPSDALHVLGEQKTWNTEAAELGARILSVEERNGRASKAAVSAIVLSQRVVELVIREATRVVLNTGLAHDPGVAPHAASWGALGDRIVGDLISGRKFAQLIRADLALTVPIVAIGAPVAAYYPEVARRLSATLAIPAHAAVCNAVGAVAGVVSQAVDILVNQPTFRVFRVHNPAGSHDFATAAAAIAEARVLSQTLALAAARRAGAVDPNVHTTVTERRAQFGGAARESPQDSADDYLAEAVVRSVATGRPFVGHL